MQKPPAQEHVDASAGPEDAAGSSSSTTSSAAVLHTQTGRFALDRARIEDVEPIVALLRDDPLGTRRESDDLDRYRRAFAAVDADPAQFLAVVRTEDGEVCGTMQLTVIPGLSRNGTTRLQIEAVRVGEAARSSGLGTAMIEWAHSYGRGRGASLVQLTTDQRREDAHRFYARLGYQPSHVGMKREL